MQCWNIVWTPGLDIFIHMIARAEDSCMVSLENEAKEKRSEFESLGKFLGG